MSASWLARDAVHSRINMLGHTAEHLAVRLSFPAKAGIIFAGKKKTTEVLLNSSSLKNFGSLVAAA